MDAGGGSASGRGYEPVKPAWASQSEPKAPLRIEFQAQFSGGPKGKDASAPKNAAASVPVGKASLDRLPQITRLLVLGHHFEMLVRKGAVKDCTEIANLTGLSRARVSQIVNLTTLAPQIQEATRRSSDQPVSAEHELRSVAADPDWRRQVQISLMRDTHWKCRL
jgi:hypothetical protein